MDISVPVLELARRDFDAEITRLTILAAAIDTAIQQRQDTRGEWRR